ncbi:type II toxin-antitoxin system VapB family antitoxin [Breznakiellaceae bacterium SP9]
MAVKQIADNTECSSDLLNMALAISGLETKQETINLTLEEFIEKRRREEVIEAFGTIDFADDWDPRKIRGKIW